jgi:hypothetical protein
MMRRWRSERAAVSAEARRDKVLARHTARTMEARNAVMGAAKSFGLETLVTAAARKASLANKSAK